MSYEQDRSVIGILLFELVQECYYVLDRVGVVERTGTMTPLAKLGHPLNGSKSILLDQDRDSSVSHLL